MLYTKWKLKKKKTIIWSERDINSEHLKNININENNILFMHAKSVKQNKNTKTAGIRKQ